MSLEHSFLLFFDLVDAFPGDLLSCMFDAAAVFLRLGLSTYEASLEGQNEDLTVVDATTIRRQVSL